jgi:tetratricopeptide (TPR) repeat protein
MRGQPVLHRLSLSLVAAGVLAATGPAMALGTGGEVTPSNTVGSAAYDAGKAAIDARKWDEALRQLAKVGASDPNRANALNYQGFASRKLGRYDAAFDFYRQALDLEPTHRGAHEYLGEAYLETGDLAKAEGEAARLSALCPSGCEEREDLDNAIAAWKKQHGA